MNWSKRDIEKVRAAAERSECRRLQVGCLLRVNGGRDFVGWNAPVRGVCSGKPGKCGCIHAEVRAMSFLLSQPRMVKTIDVLVTDSPCIGCSKSLVGLVERLGAMLTTAYLREYRLSEGVQYLAGRGVNVLRLWGEL